MKKGNLPLWIFLYILGILLLAAIVNALMGLAIPTDASLNAPTWLGFWGSYLGGAIGCIPALLALQHSMSQSEEQRQDAERNLHLSKLPVLDNHTLHILKVSDFPKGSLSSTKYFLESCHDPKGYFVRKATSDNIEAILRADHCDVILLHIKNIGHGPALSVSIHFEDDSRFPIGALAEGDSLNLLLALVRREDSTYPIKFSFSDMLDWKYSQYHGVYIGPVLEYETPISAPVLEP